MPDPSYVVVFVKLGRKTKKYISKLAKKLSSTHPLKKKTRTPYSFWTDVLRDPLAGDYQALG
jgi:hypothetical protein